MIAKLKSSLSASAKGEFAESIKGIKNALTGSDAFGSSFAKWSNLREAAQKIENVLINLKPAFAAVDAAVGMGIRPFIAMLPIIAATALPCARRARLGDRRRLAHRDNASDRARWHMACTRQVDVNAQPSMGSGCEGVAAAQWVYNAALAATAAIGIPLSGAMVAAATALAAAVGVVVAVGTGMYYLWQKLSAGDPIAKQGGADETVGGRVQRGDGGGAS